MTRYKSTLYHSLRHPEKPLNFQFCVETDVGQALGLITEDWEIVPQAFAYISSSIYISSQNGGLFRDIVTILFLFKLYNTWH